ncbi:MAG: MFS transporter, partial [Acidobacteriota bacterium]
MPTPETAVESQGTQRKWPRILAWCLYDFGTSPYSTIMVTLGFPIFFTEVLYPGKSGPLLWGILYGGSVMISGLLAPALGAVSDSVGRRKPFLVPLTLAMAAGTALCALVTPERAYLAFLFFGVANLSFSLAWVIYNSLLITVAPPGKTDTISGLGWGFGYLGGLLALILGAGLYRGGFTPENVPRIHMSFILVSVLVLVAALPLFSVRESWARKDRKFVGLGRAYRDVWRTLKEIRSYRALFFYLIAYFLFNDGLSTVIGFAGIYGKQVIHLRTETIFLLFLFLQIVAAAGAFSLGWLADRWSPKTVLYWLLGGWVLVCLGVAGAVNFWQFAAVAGFAGLLLGPTQSIARGFLATLAPDDRQGEFF